MITNMKSSEIGQIKEYENETRDSRLKISYSSILQYCSLLIVLFVNCRKKFPL